MWIEDDEAGAVWWAAAGWAELLVERAHTDRGPRERAARDTAALLIYQAALQRRCPPGQVPLAAVRQLLTVDALTAALQDVLAKPSHQYAAGQLDAGVDGAAGVEVLQPIVAQAVNDHPGATPLEDLWPPGALLSRGGGPTW